MTIHSDDLHPGQTCPLDGCDEDIVSVAHQQVADVDDVADDLCVVETDEIETDGITSLAGNVTVIFHEGPTLDPNDQ